MTTTWAKQFVERVGGKPGRELAYLSIAFTWHLPAAYQRAVWLRQQGYEVIAGGPAVMLMWDYMKDVALRGGCELEMVDAVSWHNPDATFTSRGCIRRCSFCAVPRIEGELRELDDWPVRPIVCDNNLLACGKKHFDSVVDKLKPLKGIDFNQGLDARLLTDYHASRLAELDCKVRLAFDHVSTEPQFLSAYEKLRKARIPKSRIQCYVLIGYNDTMEDALYRLRLVHNLGIRPNPMRYNPLDTLVRDSYVGPNWTGRELTRYTRYWANLRYFGRIPFEDFDRIPQKESSSQLALSEKSVL